MKKESMALSVVVGVWSFAAYASVLVVPAHRFDAGGWKLDAQFLDVVGAPYLLAHGLGNRVMDATAEVEVPEDGDYRVWAYTRNWADGAPGRFRVAVDGCVLPTEFGAGSTKWGWAAGDAVALKKGRVALALKDLTGFDGRCASLALASGGDRPEGAPDPRRMPASKTYCAEFVVVGGGLPGTCAAVAAARRGVKTILVQDRPVLGGNASAEVRVWCAGETRYDLVRELRGRFMNMEDSIALSDARRMGVVLNEPNLTVLLETRVFAAEKAADGAIAAVKAFDLKRGRTVRVEAPLFADATGDGWLGFYAGADFRMGREARSEYGEPSDFAPEKADGDTLGASLMWTSVDGNAPSGFSAPWAEPHAQGEVSVNGEWNWEYGIHRDMIADGEAIRDRLLLAIYGSFSLAKKNPENANRVLNFVPFVLGKRESRRLLGDHVYTGNDVIGKVQFEDAIAAGSWSIDLHYDDCKPGVDFLTTCRQPHYGRYWIPYRSIYSRNVPNLFVVGRCFSCTHVGLGGVRVINTLSQLGCAAGEAAALCRKYGLRPRGIYAEGRVREVQDALGGDFPGRPDPRTAGWLIVDDESAGVTFGEGWMKTHLANGDQYGDYAHFPGGNVCGPSPTLLRGCGVATYPLPVPEKGRYALMGRVPFLRTTPAGSSTAFRIVSGGRETRFSANQALDTGRWRKLGAFDLEPGATLTIMPGESSGNVVADAFALVRDGVGAE